MHTLHSPWARRSRSRNHGWSRAPAVELIGRVLTITGQRASRTDGEHVKQGLVIWGASGHALVVADIIRLVNA